MGLLTLVLLALPAPVMAGEESTLSAVEAVRLGVAASPSVAAARHRYEAALAALRGARAPFNPQAELAPGVGFTNGNAVLSQQLDIGGRLSAQSRSAAGARDAAAAQLRQAELETAEAVTTAYFDLARARALESAARESVELVRQIRDAVRRREEIGEAPRVQVTRAEIELARAEQELVRAGGAVKARLAALNLLLGRDPAAPLATSTPMALPDEPETAERLLIAAERSRPEVQVARGLVAARRGEVDLARAERRPELFAELAMDAWSLDREPFNSRDLGFQARLAFPLLDRGRLRAEVARARSGVAAQEAELESVRRALRVEVTAAAAELSAARAAVLAYQEQVLPRSRELLRATRAGFEAGLTSFLEVLEAQRLARQTRTEYENTLFEAVRARIALDRALGRMPGLPEQSR